MVQVLITRQKQIGWCTEGAKILELCEKGDKLLDEEIAKVYKGKKVSKGSFGSQHTFESPLW